ncbi:hypothetical protein F1188_11005 [Roseospira marina]|uniref:Uncharacterized protein n=1 Tax=Roseospira marina TaxID=140057 RepID=A0A5M6IB22_9PROT|nr:hypothetical protein [Roseospira marina]KAA5605423.1 hypothetical protein F1188_11005 [Roseospira marina]MBB4314583.1 hypothetical protein [Roseospira marina]MBB5088855.1 hypothetical protein [Roseospira marina]
MGLMLAACQTTTGGGRDATVRDVSVVDQPAGANCEGVVVRGSALWNEITAWRGVNPKCRRVVNDDGVSGSQFYVIAKLAPSLERIQQKLSAGPTGQTGAARVFVSVTRMDARISTNRAILGSDADETRVVSGAVPGMVMTGPVEARAVRYVGDDGHMYGCALADADTARNTTSHVMVCRTQYREDDATTLALARRIAREDFPFINP